MSVIHSQKILILDFGSQYIQPIGRRIRVVVLFSEVLGGDITVDEIRAFDPRGFMYTDGPESVSHGDETRRAPECEDAKVLPIRGRC